MGHIDIHSTGLSRTLNSSVTPGLSKAILIALQSTGIKLPVALRHGIESLAATERLPMALQDQLWFEIERQATDPDVGLTIGQALQPGNFDMLGYLLLSSPTLEEAAKGLENYSALIGQGGNFSQHSKNGMRRLIYHADFTVARQLRLDTILTCIVNGARWLTGNQLKPISIGFEHDDRGRLTAYHRVFPQAKLLLGQAANFVEFNNADWHSKLSNANSQVQTQVVAMVQQQLSQLHPQNCATQVETLLQRQPTLSRNQVAEKLAISERHLNRKLALEKLSFRMLAERIKKERVLQLLSIGNLSQANIAEKLGYADESAFAKAFRRWMGMGIREYRNTLPVEPKC